MAGKGNYAKGKGPKPEEVLRAERILPPKAEQPEGAGPRPKVEYSEAWEKEFLACVLETGAGPKVICEGEGMPGAKSVYRWLAEKPEFARRYESAKLMGIQHRFADEIVEISDDGTNDWVERLGYNGANPKMEVNGEVINRSRLRVDSRKWILAKLFPQKYGEKQQVEHTGSIDITERLMAGRARVAAAKRGNTSAK
jgi:hypothetical protein